MSEGSNLPIGEIAESLIDGPFGSNLKSEHYVDEPGIPVVRLNNVQETRFDSKDKAFVSESHAATLARHHVRPGDVLIAALGDETHPVGRSCCYPDDQPDAINKADCFRLRCKPDLAINRYVMFALNSEFARAQIRRFEQGVTRKRINLGNIQRVRVGIPDLARQRRIAEILTTVDQAIVQTEALIAKTQQIKTGLMDDLFTRGVTPDGRLRPPRDQAPHLYKPSPLGWIPREWEVVPIGSLIESWAMGPRFSADEYSDNGNVATLRTSDMDAEGNINYDSMPLASLDLSGLHQHLLRPEDLVVSRSGTCGIAGVFDGHSRDVLPGAFLIRLRFQRSILSEFARTFINSPFGSRATSRIAEGGVQKNLRGTELCRLLLPVPHREEQTTMQATLAAVDSRCRAAEEEACTLLKLKIGLMEALFRDSTLRKGDVWPRYSKA